VTSPGTAAAGSYGVGVGTSSTVGSVHTANAASTYAVAAPVALTETVSTDKITYRSGETVSITARVLQAGTAVSGAAVSFTATKPNGSKVLLSGTTDSNGYATVSFKTGKGTGNVGYYQVTAVATSGSLTTQATSTFAVSR
jgi:uncharacterized protein YfaS (alpha-2-macroglobulin family)